MLTICELLDNGNIPYRIILPDTEDVPGRYEWRQQLHLRKVDRGSLLKLKPGVQTQIVHAHWLSQTAQLLELRNAQARPLQLHPREYHTQVQASMNHLPQDWNARACTLQVQPQ
eukprot:1702840-Pyramimonas_sp.AAC.2